MLHLTPTLTVLVADHLQKTLSKMYTTYALILTQWTFGGYETLQGGDLHGDKKALLFKEDQIIG